VAQRGVELYLYSSKTSALEGGEGSASRPGRTLPPGKIRYPLYRRLGGPQGRSGGAEYLAPTEIRSPDRPARSQSLYRLSYLAHNVSFVTNTLTVRIGNIEKFGLFVIHSQMGPIRNAQISCALTL